MFIEDSSAFKHIGNIRRELSSFLYTESIQSSNWYLVGRSLEHEQEVEVEDPLYISMLDNKTYYRGYRLTTILITSALEIFSKYDAAYDVDTDKGDCPGYPERACCPG